MAASRRSEELQIQCTLERALSAPDADARYANVPGTFGGRLLNADLARLVSPRYQTKSDRIAYTRCTYLPASAYVLRRD